MGENDNGKLTLTLAGSTQPIHIAALSLAVAIRKQSIISLESALEMVRDFTASLDLHEPDASRRPQLVEPDGEPEPPAQSLSSPPPDDEHENSAERARRGRSSPSQQAQAEKRRIESIYEKTVTDDLITCLVCKKPFKTLKRHLNQVHGMSVADYFAKFDLPADYPTVSKSYSEVRQQRMNELLEKKGGSISAKKSRD